MSGNEESNWNETLTKGMSAAFKNKRMITVMQKLAYC